MANKDKFLKISTSTSGKVFTKPPAFTFLTSRSCRSPEIECLRATLAGVLLITGETKTPRGLLNIGKVHGRGIEDVCSWFQHNFCQFLLQRPKVPKELEIIDWLELQTKGLFLVRLQGADGKFEQVDHVVTVDMGTRTVWDPAEKLVMSIMSGVFDVCVQDDFEFIGICELKVLEKQELRKRNKKYSKKTTEKRRDIPKKRR